MFHSTSAGKVGTFSSTRVLIQSRTPIVFFVTAVLLENQENSSVKTKLCPRNQPDEQFQLTQVTATRDGGFGGGSAAGPTAGFDPVLISLIRRSMPNLVAYDLAAFH